MSNIKKAKRINGFNAKSSKTVAAEKTSISKEAEEYLATLSPEVAAVHRIAIDLFNEEVESSKEDENTLWQKSLKAAEVKHLQILDAQRTARNIGNSKRVAIVQKPTQTEKPKALVRLVQTEPIVGKSVSGNLISKANALITDIHKQMAGLIEIDFFDSGFDLFYQLDKLIKENSIPMNNLAMKPIDFDSRVKETFPSTNWFDLRTRYYTTLAQKLTFLYCNNDEFKKPKTSEVLNYLYSRVYKYTDNSKQEIKYLDRKSLGFSLVEDAPSSTKATQDNIDMAKQYLNIINSQIAGVKPVDFFDLSYSYDYFKLLAKMVEDGLVSTADFAMSNVDFDSRRDDKSAPLNWLDLRCRYYATLAHRVTIFYCYLEEYKRKLIAEGAIKYLYSQVYSCNAILQREQVNTDVVFAKESSVLALRSAKLKEITRCQKLWSDIVSSTEGFPEKYAMLAKKISAFNISASELNVEPDEFYSITENRRKEQLKKSTLLSNVDIGISNSKIERANNDAVSEEVYRSRVIWREIKEQYDDFPNKFTELMGLMNLHDISVEQLLENEETFRKVINARKVEQHDLETESFAKPLQVSLADILGEPMQQEAETTETEPSSVEPTEPTPVEEPVQPKIIIEEVENNNEVEIEPEPETFEEVSETPIKINEEDTSQATVEFTAKREETSPEPEEVESIIINSEETANSDDSLNTEESEPTAKKGWLNRLSSLFSKKGNDLEDYSTVENAEPEILPDDGFVDDVRVIRKVNKETEETNNLNASESPELVRDTPETLANVVKGNPEDEDRGEEAKTLVMQKATFKANSFEDAIRHLINEDKVAKAEINIIVTQFTIAKNKYQDKGFKQACKFMDDKIKDINKYLNFEKVFGNVEDFEQQLKQLNQFVFSK